ncbi:regulator of G-protein signaling 19 isoform X3 [Pteropus alecto]|uniref:regulator of G-protein signaling 19 isoform X3 n=1 Tax=Pteropus alecto TaxID=9402 RepID=UPI0003F127B3|nr:regulator of G-protein signaling 19 isoform X3 [Pteropus alecto]
MVGERAWGPAPTHWVGVQGGRAALPGEVAVPLGYSYQTSEAATPLPFPRNLNPEGKAVGLLLPAPGCEPPILSRSDRQVAVVRVPEPAPRSPGNLHPPMPTPHEAGNQHTGPEEADQPPSMSSHDVASPAAPSRNPCCLCWCCCCSCSWNEERRRAWRASRESKLQPLPSCEVCSTPSPEEVRGWAQSFDKLMHSPAGRSAFREFLRTEYSEENMLFWLACEELKAEADQHAVDEKARLIYEDYVSILSPKEVSLDSRIREGINKKMQEPSAHTFDDAQLQIYTLMHRDPYPRFLGSPAYRALLLRGAPQSSHEA